MALMNIAYCDESEAPRIPRVYMVSGYLGSSLAWYDLRCRWQSALKEEGLLTTGFHMYECESGDSPPYDAMDLDVRRHLQRRFIDIIRDTQLWGFACAIELQYYNKIIDKIKLSRRNHYDPYYLAFQYIVEEMSLALNDGGIPKGEVISFIFDQNQKHQDKAKDLYDSIKRSETLTYIHRLGSLTFDSRLCQLPLQAADIWAYESMKHIREVKIIGRPVRWQYNHLIRTGGRVHHHDIKVFERQTIEQLERLEGW